MADQPAEAIELREIGAEDKPRRFFLRDPQYLPLTMFLQKDAKRHHTENAAKTYVCVTPDKRIVGYISLNCSSIALDAPPDGLQGYRYPDYPAVKIGKLAVDVHYRDFDLGSKLVSLAVATVTQKIMPFVGCRFMIVDSHREAVGFYEKRGFTLLDTEENRARPTPLMFLDLGRLA